MKRFALAGNPNSGKTTLFNMLTGSTAKVGNWAGVTVDKREGKYRKLKEEINIVDLPGIYSLSPYTPEEVVSRNYVLDEKPDLVIDVVDATNLERNLYLTTQLLEIDVPVVVALNFADMLTKNGDKVDIEKLSTELGVPVIEVSALKNLNLDKLMEVAYETCKTPRKGLTKIEDKRLAHLIADVNVGFKALGVDNPMFHSLKIIELDELEIKNHPTLLPVVEDFKKTFHDDLFGSDFEALIADARYKYITKHFQNAFISHKKSDEEEETTTDKIDKVLTHKFWAFPILILIMAAMFHFTFSSDLFLMSKFGLNIESEGWINFFTGMGYEGEALTEIPSLGVFLQNWTGWFTSWVIELISNLFTNWGVRDTWYACLLTDGILEGVGAVLSFVPQILLLFLFIAILEDSGYMARVAFILDRAFRKFGLSGKAFIPMLTGFGCSVPAIMATRTLQDEKEKNLTIRLMTCFSCGAKAPIWAMLAQVGSILGFAYADAFVFIIYVFGIVLAIILAIFLKLFTKDTYVSPFLMELPTYHLPQAKNVLAHLWDKLKHYLSKASTIITASLVVVWFLTNFGWAFWNGMVDDISLSILADLGRVFRYFFYPMGWSMSSEYGWKLSVASITGLIAKEDVVGTLGVLGISEDTATTSLIGMPAAALLSYGFFNLLTIPCFAAISTARAEQTKKEFIKTIIFWFGLSYVVATAIYWIGSLFALAVWAGLFVVIMLIAFLALAVVFQNKSRKVTE